MIKGMFGRYKRPAWQTPGIGDGLPGAGNLPPETMQQTQKPSFLGEGGAGRAIAGTLGDFLLQYNGFSPVYAPQQQQEAFLNAQAQRDAAKRFAGLQDYETKKQIDQQYPTQKAPKYWERNDGSLMTIDPEGKPKVVYEDPNIPLVPGRDGKFYPQQFAPRKPVGKLSPIGGSSPTMQNTRMPKLSSNGFPKEMTQRQYQVVIGQMGKAATDAWMQRNNIKIGSQ